MIKNYLAILEESLDQKAAVLDEITGYCREQEALLKQETLDLESFDSYVDRKDLCIQKLAKLDEGFETLYERMKEQLAGGKEAYKDQIARIQQKITVITEKSVSIQAQEVRNKKMVEDYFTKERSQLRQGRQASKAAYGYYKNMNNSNVVPPQFLDSKQ